MHQSHLKQKFRNRELTIGTWLTLGHPAVVEVAAQADLDWMCIDMEHSPLSLDQCQELIRTCDLLNIPPLVRIGANDELLIKNAMDAGAHGIIVPMVCHKSDVEKALNAVYYPPKGTRGVGLARAQKYGFGFEDYQKWLVDEACVIVQIEHKDALENLDEIFSNKDVDGFIIGPYDISASFGFPGQFDHPQVVEALDVIKEYSKKHSLLAGYHVVPPQPELAKEKIQEGYKLISYSVDYLLLGSMLKQGVDTLKK